jgi:MarR family transcriptional regulator, organic hydroperoxide resistance regulator
MSTSKTRKRPGRGRRIAPLASEVKAGFRLPATVSRPALLEQGSDERFRRLVYDLLTISSRMTVVREHLGGRMGINAPQYSLLMAVGQFQGENGVGVTAVARVLHVSSAFVATESGKLAQAGLLTKRANPRDRRGVLLSLSRAGRTLIERNNDEVKALNDIFFGALTPAMFAAASAATVALVRGSARALAHLQLPELAS